MDLSRLWHPLNFSRRFPNGTVIALFLHHKMDRLSAWLVQGGCGIHLPSIPCLWRKWFRILDCDHQHTMRNLKPFRGGNGMVQEVWSTIPTGAELRSLLQKKSKSISLYFFEHVCYTLNANGHLKHSVKSILRFKRSSFDPGRLQGWGPVQVAMPFFRSWCVVLT